MSARWAKITRKESWLIDQRFKDDEARGKHSELISKRVNEWTESDREHPRGATPELTSRPEPLVSSTHREQRARSLDLHALQTYAIQARAASPRGLRSSPVPAAGSPADGSVANPLRRDNAGILAMPKSALRRHEIPPYKTGTYPEPSSPTKPDRILPKKKPPTNRGLR
jgi:hypothetical protein